MPGNGWDIEESAFDPWDMPGGMGRDAVVLEKAKKVPLSLSGRETLGDIPVDENLQADVNTRKHVSSRFSY
jgi:hypothetical protein